LVPVVEVLNLSTPPEVPPELIDWSIEAPTAGTKEDVYALRVQGWVLGRTSQIDSVEFVCEERVIRSVPVQGRRSDINRNHPEVPDDVRCGFRALVGVVGLPPRFELNLRAVLVNEGRVPLGSIRARHSSVRSAFKPALQPLIVTSLGRSGSTWLMAMVAAHPQIVVEGDYPYEFGTARYWAQVLKVLSEPAEPHSSNGRSLETDIWHVGYNPFYIPAVAGQPELRTWLGREQIERAATFCVESIERSYLAVGRSTGKGDVSYFAEKHLARPGRTATLIRELYDNAKEVFVVRDFRDALCSFIDYDNVLGANRPGAEREQVARWSRWAADLERTWKARQLDSHLVHYEEMVRRPHETLDALLEYLNLERSSRTLSQMLKGASTKAPELHLTSSNAAESIGRWQRESDEFQALCNHALSEPLRAFGYISRGE
jgi:hypothetical protein